MLTELEAGKGRNRQLIAEKTGNGAMPIRIIFRFIGRDMYIKGSHSSYSHQVVNQMKEKNALKSYREERGWVKIIFVDTMTEDDVQGELFSKILEGYEQAGFDCNVTELEL